MSVAAGRYSRVSRRMWGDAKVRRLSAAPPNAQTLWFRLLTGPELTNIPGLFPAWESGLAQALGWDVEAFRDTFREVCAEGLAKADWMAGLVFVPNAIEHNQPSSPNVVRSWKTAWSDMPECALKTEAYHALKAFVDSLGKGWAQAFAESCPNPSPNQTQIQEQEQIQILNIHTGPVTGVRLKPTKPHAVVAKSKHSRTQIPEDWAPSERCTELLCKEGIDYNVAHAGVADFIDYWRGEGRLKADWDATFRGRMRALQRDGRLPAPLEPQADNHVYIETTGGKRVRKYVSNGKVVKTEPAEVGQETLLPEVKTL